MKIAVIGHVDHGKSCLTSAIIEVMKNKGVEVVTIEPEYAQDRGIVLTSLINDEAKSITNEMRCNLFSQPMTRSERRKQERKNKKR